MKRLKSLFFQGNLFLQKRNFNVVSPTEFPRSEKVPAFGKRRRKQKDISPQPTSSNISEKEARLICLNNYGFLQKPLYQEKWAEFLSELRRIELSWRLFPVANGGIDLTVLDHSEELNKTLHIFRGVNGQGKSSPMADLFEACGSIINGSIQEENIYFKYENKCESLRLNPQKRDILFPPKEEDYGYPVMARSQCTRVAVNVSHVNMSTGVSTPLLRNISFQTFVYCFLTSIPVFLKRTDIGVRNLDFVSAEQMSHFRFAWCYLRREAWMTPLEMEEFDTLLPPK